MPGVVPVLGGPARRPIVHALRGGERSVNQLVETVDSGQPGVSRQLQILEDANFVVVRPQGRQRFYALRPDPFQELSQFVTTYRTIWEGRLDRLAAELERRRKAKNKKEKPQ